MNEPAYALGIVREDCPDIDRAMHKVAAWTGRDYFELKEFYNKNKKRVKPFEPLILIPDLTFEQLALIETNKLRWPGLEVQFRPRRLYRYGTLLAHVLGYVAEANEEELEKNQDLALGDYVGKQGIEFMLERPHARDQGAGPVRGGRQRPPPQGAHPQAPPAPGTRFPCPSTSTCRSWPWTGWTRKRAAWPSWTRTPASSGRWQRPVLQLQRLFLGPDPGPVGQAQGQPAPPHAEPGHPVRVPARLHLQARGGRGRLHYATIDPNETVLCTGATRLGRRVFRCWRKGGHGNVNLERALVESCDVYFYKQGKKLTVDRMAEFAQAVGFGHKTGIRLPHEKAGNIPTREWKRKRFGESWQGGDNLNMAIGQGYTLVTPLQVARFFASLLNGGKLLKPLLLKDAKTEVQAEIPLKPDQVARLKRALVQAVENDRGTCRRLRTKDVTVGGKTGTAQVVRLTDELKELKDDEIPYRFRDHAWMAAIVEKDGRRFAIAALIEHGLHGASGAGPVVKAVIDYLFKGEVRLKPEEKKAKARAVRALSLKPGKDAKKKAKPKEKPDAD